MLLICLKKQLVIRIPSSQDSGVSPWGLGQRADCGSDSGLSGWAPTLPPQPSSRPGITSAHVTLAWDECFPRGIIGSLCK